MMARYVLKTQSVQYEALNPIAFLDTRFKSFASCSMESEGFALGVEGVFSTGHACKRFNQNVMKAGNLLDNRQYGFLNN